MPLSKKLVDAAKAGDQKPIHEYLTKRGNINDIDEEGKGGLLHHAMESQQNELAKFLLANGADPNLRSKNNPTYKLYSITPFHKAAAVGNVEGMKILLNNNVPIDVRDINNATALHGAIWNGQIESVKFLISMNANVNARTDEGHTPMHTLCRYKMDSQVKKNIAQQLIQVGTFDFDLKIRVKIADIHNYFFSVIEFAMFYDEYQIAALLEEKQRSDTRVTHTTQLQLLQTLETLIKKMTTSEKRIDQINLSQTDTLKSEKKEEEKGNSESFFGFTQKNG